MSFILKLINLEILHKHFVSSSQVLGVSLYTFLLGGFLDYMYWYLITLLVYYFLLSLSKKKRTLWSNCRINVHLLNMITSEMQHFGRERNDLVIEESGSTRLTALLESY